jgi:hypothetical protein
MAEANERSDRNTNPFAFVDSITFTKVHIMPDEMSEKAYSPFKTNRSLSLHLDTLLLADEMNLRYSLPNRQQYEFLLQMVSPRKRFAKWPKKLDNEALDVVQAYCGVNRVRAEEILNILTEDQIKQIQAELAAEEKLKNEMSR